MSHFQHALSSIRSIPWSRYYGEFNKVCNTKNARKAGLATIDLATKNPLGAIATAALVILAWEFKKERNEHLAKQKEAESKLLEQKEKNKAQSKTHQILERELQLQKAREVAKEQAETKRVSDAFDKFRRESTGGDTVSRQEATRLADEAAKQATLLAKTEVTDRLSTVLGWDVSQHGEATLDGLIGLIERYVEAYRENQLLKLQVLGKLNELLTKYGITSLNDLSEFDPKVLEESVNASILEAGDTGVASARGELSEMLNSIYDQVAAGRGSKNVNLAEVGSAIDALAQKELEVRATLEKLERETLTALRKENQTLKLANDELEKQIRSLSVSVDPGLTPSKTLAPGHVSSTIDFRIKAAVTKALEAQALEHEKALRKETEAARLILEKASQENAALRKRVEAAELASQQARRSIEDRARENRDLQARLDSLLEEVERHKVEAAKWHELHTQLQSAHKRAVADSRGTPRSAMKGGQGHDRGRTPNRVSFTPGREDSHSPIVISEELRRQRQAEEKPVLEGSDDESSSKGGSEDGVLRGGRPRRANAGKKSVWRQLSNGDYGTHTPGKPAAGRGGKGGRGSKKK